MDKMKCTLSDASECESGSLVETTLSLFIGWCAVCFHNPQQYNYDSMLTTMTPSMLTTFIMLLVGLESKSSSGIGSRDDWWTKIIMSCTKKAVPRTKNMFVYQKTNSLCTKFNWPCTRICTKIYVPKIYFNRKVNIRNEYYSRKYQIKTI